MNIQTMRWGLEELSDRSLQEKLWTGKLDGEMSSFPEALVSTFDSSGLGKALETGRCEGLSSKAVEIAKQLDVAVRKVPQSEAPAEIIAHPAMEKVRSLANDLLILTE